MWPIEASGVCKVLLETSATNWRSSSIKLLEFIKISWRICISIGEATGRNTLASCGQEVRISTLRSFEAVDNLECFRIAKFLQQMKSTAICNSLSYSSLGMVTFPPEWSTCSMTTFSGDNWEFHSFIQGINCRDHRDKCENETHVVGSHITFLWSYLSATNREDKNTRYDKQVEWWIIGDCYQVTIRLLNMYDHKTYYTDLLQRLYFFDTAKQSACGSCEIFIHTLCQIVAGVVVPYYSTNLQDMKFCSEACLAFFRREIDRQGDFLLRKRIVIVIRQLHGFTCVHSGSIVSWGHLQPHPPFVRLLVLWIHLKY